MKTKSPKFEVAGLAIFGKIEPAWAVFPVGSTKAICYVESKGHGKLIASALNNYKICR